MRDHDPNPLLTKVVLFGILFWPLILVLPVMLLNHHVHDALTWVVGVPAILQFTTCFMLISKNPLEWWGPFIGIEVTAGPFKDHGSDVTSKEIRDWVRESIKGPYIGVSSVTYKFLRKRDAMLFKLTWCGR